MNRNVAFAAITCLALALVFGGATAGPRAAWAQDVGPQGDSALQATVGTAFTFQGRLVKNGNPVDGVTCTFTFALHGAASGGSSLATVSPTAQVSDGYFTANVDFGAGVFEGEARWVEVSVQCPGDGSAVPLNDKRIPLNPAPYALSLRPGASIEATSTNALNVKTAATSGAALDAEWFDVFEPFPAEGRLVLSQVRENSRPDLAIGLRHVALAFRKRATGGAEATKQRRQT